MGRFQTIKFRNEIDPVWGLETLVNEHFYEIFEHFNKNNTVLIPQNRLFITRGLKFNDYNINGIKSILDFSAYVIRLEQKIGISNKDASFALSFQE